MQIERQFLGTWTNYADTVFNEVTACPADIRISPNGLEIKSTVAVPRRDVWIISFILLVLAISGFGLLLVPFFWKRIWVTYSGTQKETFSWKDVEFVAFNFQEMLLYGSGEQIVRGIFKGEIAFEDIQSFLPPTVQLHDTPQHVHSLITVDELILQGKWQGHWTWGKELTRVGGMKIQPQGLVVEGYRSSMLRSTLFFALSIGSLILCSAGFLAGPTLSIYLSTYLVELLIPLMKLSLLTSIFFIVLFLPLVVFWRWLLFPFYQQFVPWEALDSVGLFTDGLWVEFEGVEGRIRGHFVSKEFAEMQKGLERILFWDKEITVMSAHKRTLPIYLQRLLLLGVAISSVAFTWVYQEEHRNFIQGLNQHIQTVNPVQKSNQATLDVLRKQIADIVVQHPLQWNATQDVDWNQRNLLQQFGKGVLALPKSTYSMGIYLEQVLDVFPYSDFMNEVSYGNGSLLFLEFANQLDALVPNEHVGDGFLLSLSAAYLSHYPPSISLIDTRIQIAQNWLDTGTVRGNDTCVLISRFITSQLTEITASAYRNGSISKSEAESLAKKLHALGSNLDIPLTTMEKIVQNMLAGNRQYIVNRAKLKLASYINNPNSNISALSKSKFSMASNGQFKAWSEGRLFKDGREIGWIGLVSNQNALHTTWHVTKGKSRSFQQIAQNIGRRPLMVTAGSYVTSKKLTSGISSVDGVIQNYAVDNGMDGIVLFHDGNVLIQNMEEGILLPGTSNPLRIDLFINDYLLFVQWLQKERASAFQTHLLGWENNLAIDPVHSSTTVRERRLLLTMTKNGTSGLAIVDLPQVPRPLSLSEAAATALFSLQQFGWNVDAIANLDVGSYNILYRLNKNVGQSLGPVSLNQAHNLIVISQ